MKGVTEWVYKKWCAGLPAKVLVNELVNELGSIRSIQNFWTDILSYPQLQRFEQKLVFVAYFSYNTYMNTKYILGIIALLVLIGGGTYFITQQSADNVVVVNDAGPETMPVEPDGGIGDGAEPLDELLEEESERGDSTTIGTSVDGTALTAYHFGNGEREVLLVGGVHGSYSPNTSALADDLVEHYSDNPDAIPDGVMLTIIPNLNPDGLKTGGTPGRFNANTVDLNRNFDCEWSATGVWRDQEVSGGSAAFSEPEAVALRDYVLEYDPEAAIVWFSAEGKVYPSACGSAPSTGSVTVAATFASAAGYPTEAEFDAYAITGDMVNWMASEDISAISVLLTDHQGAEFSKNLAGVEAVMGAYSN